MVRARLVGASLLVAVVLVAFGACGADAGPATTGSSSTQEGSTTTTAATPTTDRLRGFALSPLGFDAAGFATFLDRLAESATLLEWVGDAFEWEGGSGGADVTVQLAESAGVEPITIGGWTHTEDGSLVRPLDDTAFQTYVEAAADFATRRAPRFMGFGVEVDTHWREFPDQWERSTELFAAVADAIHQASPETRVFVVFQLERLRGMQGGLFGDENSDSLAAWELLGDFPSADLIAFTTYPGLVYEEPGDMPDDYYLSIAEHADRPVAFTEMGWQASGEYGAWSGSEQRQRDFVERFPDMISGLDVAFYTWSFMYDQAAVPDPFPSMGLIDTAGEPRAAWEAWLAQG